MPSAPLTATVRIELPRPFWLRCILPEYLRAFWGGLMGRPLDMDAVARRIHCKIRYSVK